jgi:hypothetical protein
MNDEVLSAYVDELLRERDVPVAEYAQRHQITDPETVALLQTARLVHRTVQAPRPDEETQAHTRERLLRDAAKPAGREETVWWQRLRRRGH